MRNLFLLCLLFAFSYAMLPGSCGHDEKNTPAHKEQFRQLLSNIKNSTRPHKRETLELIRIPVVIHIFHAGVNDPTYVTDEEIEAELTFLDDWFNARNAHYDTANPAWDNVRAVQSDFQLSFELATRDPDGQPSTGVYRYENPTIARELCGEDEMFRPADGGVELWPVQDYYSVYICSLEGLLGYAYLPVATQSGDSFFYDAMVLNSVDATGGTRYIGNTFFSGSTFAHETGHYLGLDHTFANDNGGCDDDDGISDTPQTDAQSFDYIEDNPPTACGPNYVRCNGVPAQVQNNMDYNFEPCLAFMTKEQASTMRSILEATEENRNSRSSLRFSNGLARDCIPECAGRDCGEDGCGGSCGNCDGIDICTEGSCVPSCVPDCDGLVCGDDGCGGSCGVCQGESSCQQGACICEPNCNTRDCGDDGCGGSCGSCGNQETCNTNGECVCEPNCNGIECGDNGCSGSCGSCSQGFSCTAGECVSNCIPDCSNRVCGTDGCGGTCGSCSQGLVCSAGQCESTCTPDCNGRVCGTDGCEGTCGSCSQGFGCTNVGQCEAICMPDCNGRVCGSDGCGGSCGDCQGQSTCNPNGECVSNCMPDCNGRVCGDNGCGGSCGTCQGQNELCDNFGQCNCQRNCENRLCGDDGCGGSCGSCGTQDTCTIEGLCICESICIGRECGDDGCGGSCGSCTDGLTCSSGVCTGICTPDCSNRACGDDGCGGSCGSCTDGLTCSAGDCVAVCTPDCSNRFCGDDGCNGSCGSCDENETCNSQQQCEELGPCIPDCVGKECGQDGCGGFCANCEQDSFCNSRFECERITDPNCASCFNLFVADVAGEPQEIDFITPNVQVFGNSLFGGACSFFITSFQNPFPSPFVNDFAVEIEENCNVLSKGAKVNGETLELCFDSTGMDTEKLCLAERVNGDYVCVDNELTVNSAAPSSRCGRTTNYGIFTIAELKEPAFSSYSYSQVSTEDSISSGSVDTFSYASGTLSFTNSDDSSSNSAASLIVNFALIMITIFFLY